jgi:hypothetical protein
MTKGTLIRTLGLATGLLLALAASAQAATPSDGANLQQPYPLTDATRFVVQGRQDGVAANGDGTRRPNCRMPQPSLSLAPRERAIELRQLSFNPRTCRATFERGVPPRSSQRPPSEKPQSAGAKRAGGSAAGVNSLVTGYRWSGYGRAWYRDSRTGKVVNEVNSGADWNRNGGCIGTNNIWFSNYASTATGWFEVSRRWSYVNRNCDYLVSSTNAHFRDRRFTGCSGGPAVDAYYSRVRFVGYPNGGIKGSRSSRIEPSCKDTLIAYFALYRR